MSNLETKEKEIIEKFKNGITVNQLIIEYGYKSTTSIYNILRKHNIAYRQIAPAGEITPEKIKSIIRDYNENILTLKKIGKKNKLDPRTITRILRENNIAPHTDIADRVGMLDNCHDAIITAYQNGYNSTEIALLYGCSSVSIRRVLKENNVKQRPLTQIQRKYTIDENFFDIIDTEEKAYILGWFYSDGYNYKRTSTATIMIRDYDEEILLKIQNIMKHNAPLYVRKRDTGNLSVLSICCQRISNMLDKHGCMQAKAHKIRLPVLEINLMSHFIRGYFDGDGSISIHADGNFSFNIASNNMFCNDLKEYLSNKLNVHIGISSCNETSGHIQTSNRKTMLKLYNYMYDNATIWLNRKHERWQLFLNKFKVDL